MKRFALILLATAAVACVEDEMPRLRAWNITVDCVTPFHWKVTGDFEDTGTCGGEGLRCVHREDTLIATEQDLAAQSITREFACWPVEESL